MTRNNLLQWCMVTIAVIAALSNVHAQSGKKGGGSISFKVTRFDPLDRPPPEFLVGTKGAGIEVKIPLTYIAGPFKTTLREGGYLDFWQTGGDKPEISIRIGEEERKNLLLVFYPSKEGFSILKINTAQNRFKGGDRYIVNATNSDIALKLGNMNPLLVKADKTGILHAPKTKNTLPVQIKQREKEDWRLVSTENWYFDRRFRKFLFIYHSSKSSAILFHGVSERLPGT